MKRALVATLALIVVAGLVAGTAALAKEGEGAKYVCTHCKVGSDGSGKCPLCSEEMKKAGAYLCPACDTTSEKPGKCPCGKDYVKVELAGKKCAGCGYYMAKDARGCAVCKKMQGQKPS
jgi:hypothetical protein